MATSVLLELMTRFRLSVAEVSRTAGVSPATVIRLRRSGEPSSATHSRDETLRRVADGIEDLTALDGETVFRQMVAERSGSTAAVQTDLGIRGPAELMAYYQRLSPIGRHILLQQARVLANELPDSEATDPEG